MLIFDLQIDMGLKGILNVLLMVTQISRKYFDLWLNIIFVIRVVILECYSILTLAAQWHKG